MKVDCYNACTDRLINLHYGDTFYFENDLYIKVQNGLVRHTVDDSYAVLLSTGRLDCLPSDTVVTLADTMVVAQNG